MKKLRTYKSLDVIPVYNFDKIKTDSRYIYEISTLDGISELQETKETVEISEDIQNEYFNKFGFTDDFKERLELEKHIALMECEYMINNDRSLLTFIEVEEKKKDDGKGEGMSIEQIASMIMLNKGIDIDTRKMSATRFYTLLREFNKEMKALSDGKKDR